MDEIFNEVLEEYDELLPKEEVIVELPKRENPFCVISKATRGEYLVHDIQTNSTWGKNPYGEDYAIVPDAMVPDIMATKGFCDIVLSEDGTEVVEFTAREIPEIPQEEVTAEPNADDIINAMLGLEG